MKLAVLWEEQY